MTSFRWDDCPYLKNQEIGEYYKNNDETVLYILAKGFDPRMCVGYESIRKAYNNIDVYLIEYDEGPNSSSLQYMKLVEENYTYLTSSTGVKLIRITSKDIVLPAIFKANLPKSELNNYTRIIVDISAMPQSISFNLIKYLVYADGITAKVDVLVCENSAFDDEIIPTGLAETANYLTGFNVFQMGRLESEDAITVWLPLLGKNCRDEIEKIYPFVSPNEICPVLPFPSSNPRKADEIMLSLGELLFTSFNVEKKNLIYVPESNALQTYKKICNVVEYYNEVLRLIKSSQTDKPSQIKFILSNATSKLIGLGALLAYLDISSRPQKITASFVFVNNDGYHIKMEAYDARKNNLYCVCLKDSIFDW